MCLPSVCFNLITRLSGASPVALRNSLATPSVLATSTSANTLSSTSTPRSERILGSSLASSSHESTVSCQDVATSGSSALISRSFRYSRSFSALLSSFLRIVSTCCADSREVSDSERRSVIYWRGDEGVATLCSMSSPERATRAVLPRSRLPASRVTALWSILTAASLLPVAGLAAASAS